MFFMKASVLVGQRIELEGDIFMVLKETSSWICTNDVIPFFISNFRCMVSAGLVKVGTM